MVQHPFQQHSRSQYSDGRYEPAGQTQRTSAAPLYLGNCLVELEKGLLGTEL
jgi:hypothetical protein